ncbi:uncharacterized protein At3g28850-like [Solanum dulcamara]|uniref:uncharacterized protein At3g28850-like n=1 Tax=Solanum dulcamara TaxID=45834 RepID=UPI002485E229|nr:uncharacterized protein At3g28850-like [Solanum dulcamara]
MHHFQYLSKTRFFVVYLKKDSIFLVFPLMGCSVSRYYHDFITRDISNSHSQSPYSSSIPVSTTLFLPTPPIHYPPLCKGDSNHLVSLTSSTYGSLDPRVPDNPTTCEGDPLSPDAAINTWELMEGLDDLDFRMVYDIQKEFVKSNEIVEHPDTKPLWKHLSEESLLAKMDPNLALSYRKALYSSKRYGHHDLKIVRFVESSDDSSSSLSSLLANTDIYLKGTEDRIVLYFTSLRGIRKTYEDCCSTRMIFKGLRICVDERDISMDSSYRKELQGVLEGKTLSLPQLFIRGKYIGGLEEIKQLGDTGELAKLLEGFPVMIDDITCQSCGEVRFVPCPGCNGSQKLFKRRKGSR